MFVEHSNLPALERVADEMAVHCNPPGMVQDMVQGHTGNYSCLHGEQVALAASSSSYSYVRN